MLISGKEEPETPLSPAMDAVIRIFKRISGLSESEGDSKASGAAAVAFSSIRLLVASTQAINLIGKQGSLIKSIQESTGASVRVLSGGMLLMFHVLFSKTSNLCFLHRLLALSNQLPSFHAFFSLPHELSYSKFGNLQFIVILALQLELSWVDVGYKLVQD